MGRLSTDLASRIVGESLHEETRQKGIVDRFLQARGWREIQPEKVGAGAPANESAHSQGESLDLGHGDRGQDA